VDYRICEVLQERVYRKSVKMNADELKQLLIAAWFGIQQSVADQAIEFNSLFALMHVSKPKEII